MTFSGSSWQQKTKCLPPRLHVQVCSQHRYLPPHRQLPTQYFHSDCLGSFSLITPNAKVSMLYFSSEADPHTVPLTSVNDIVFIKLLEPEGSTDHQ